MIDEPQESGRRKGKGVEFPHPSPAGAAALVATHFTASHKIKMNGPGRKCEWLVTCKFRETVEKRPVSLARAFMIRLNISVGGTTDQALVGEDDYGYIFVDKDDAEDVHTNQDAFAEFAGIPSGDVQLREPKSLCPRGQGAG
jgi:hypothetical protein